MVPILGMLEKQSVDKTILHSMQSLLSYRGDDNQKDTVFHFTNFLIGGYHSVGIVGNNVCQSNILITIDGAIYNAEELYVHIDASQLDQAKKNDANLFLQLYQLYGFKKALRMLDGAFAVSLLDVNRNVLYIARDRVGIKPIYYYRKNDMFLFASEYKAFYCHPKFNAELNEDAVSEYFIFRYPAGEITFLKDVFLVKPSTYLEITADKFSEHSYWELPRPNTNKLTFEENKKKLKDFISKSVSRRLKCDGPIGVQLSGGVDSSYVAAMMREQLGGEIKSYSIVMEDRNISEEEYIDVVNTTQNLAPHKLLLDANVFLQNWEKSTWFYESPLQHEGNVPLLQLNKEASNKVSVLFCGDGADECIGGYNRFATIMKYRNLRQRLCWYRSQLINFIKGRRYYKSIDEYFISLSQFLTNDELMALRPESYNKDIKIAYRRRKKIISSCHSISGLHHYLEYEMVTYLRDTLLRGDKMASASNLEMRAPLLMHELIEFLQSIPEEYLVNPQKEYNYNTKIILKSLCGDIYGEEFTYRNKVGLGIPMHTILNNKNVCTYIEKQLLPGIQQRKIVDYDYVKSIWEQVPTFTSNADTRIQVLWLAFSFEIWAQLYLDSNPAKRKSH